jgi:hypothetical protein
MHNATSRLAAHFMDIPSSSNPICSRTGALLREHTHNTAAFFLLSTDNVPTDLAIHHPCNMFEAALQYFSQ